MPFIDPGMIFLLQVLTRAISFIKASQSDITRSTHTVPYDNNISPLSKTPAQ